MTLFRVCKSNSHQSIKQSYIKIHKLSIGPINNHNNNDQSVSIYTDDKLQILIDDKLKSNIIQTHYIQLTHSPYNIQYQSYYTQLFNQCRLHCVQLQQYIIQLNEYYVVTSNKLNHSLQQIIARYIELHQYTIQCYINQLNNNPYHQHSDTNKRKRQRQNFSAEAVAVLKTWYDEHQSDCYPNADTKFQLMKLTNLSYDQVSNWFINLRQRVAKLTQCNTNRRYRKTNTTQRKHNNNNNHTMDKIESNLCHSSVIVPLEYNDVEPIKYNTIDDTSVLDAIARMNSTNNTVQSDNNNNNNSLNMFLFTTPFNIQSNTTHAVLHDDMNDTNSNNNTVTKQSSFMNSFNFHNTVRMVSSLHNQLNLSSPNNINIWQNNNNILSNNTSITNFHTRNHSLNQYSTINNFLNSINQSNSSNNDNTILSPRLTYTSYNCTTPLLQSKSIDTNIVPASIYSP